MFIALSILLHVYMGQNCLLIYFVFMDHLNCVVLIVLVTVCYVLLLSVAYVEIFFRVMPLLLDTHPLITSYILCLQYALRIS